MQFLFGSHVLDIQRRELRRGSTLVSVEPQVFDLLTYLVQNRDRVVSKDDLIASVWGGRIVSDSTLASRINAARRAVGDSGEEQRLIRTVARKGIRFVSPVRTQPPTPAAGAAAPLADLPRATHANLARPDQPAIAVLPFINMSDEPEQEYFSDGISEDIITALSRLRWFLVIARNSSFAYKGRSTPMKQIAEELGVGYLVEGSVRKSGDRVRITAQLSDVATGSQLWAERYDRHLADVFAVQDEITEAVVAAIEPQLYLAENFHAQRKSPHDLRAWDLVMRGLSHFWRATRDDNLEAGRLLGEAIAVDPNYAQALAVLSVSNNFGAQMGWEDPATAIPAGERLGLAAMRADSDDPWAHLAVATAHMGHKRFEEALAVYESALRLNPSFALAQAFYGCALSALGRCREGGAAARRALRLSPRDPFSAVYSVIAGYAEYAVGNFEEAMRLARDAIRQRPDVAAGYRVLTAAAAMAGEPDIARAALEGLRRAQPNVSLAWMARQMLIKDEAHRVHYLEGFRRAGLE